jgi:hypothetical protein
MSDIGVGANGAVWAVSSNQLLYRWTGSAWTEMPSPIPGASAIEKAVLESQNKPFNAGAVRVSVDPQGNPWVVNASASIYTWSNNRWVQRSGAAKDVAACGNGDVYIVGSDSNAYKWNGASWDKQPGSNFLNIGCDGQGKLFASLTNRLIFSSSDSAKTPSGQLTICRAPYSGGMHIGQLHTTACVITYGGKEYPIKNYQVAVDIGATSGNKNRYMVSAAESALNKATTIQIKVSQEASVAQANAIKSLKDYQSAVVNAAIAQANIGVKASNTLASGQINYVAMVGGSSNLGGGLGATGSAGVDYGIKGQLTTTGASGSYTFTAQTGGSVTYGDSDYNTTISGLAKYEQSVSGCIGVDNQSACLFAAANNTASLEGKVGSNVALGSGTTLSSGVTGTLSTGYYGKAGFEAGPSGASGGFEGTVGSSAKSEVNYGVYNDGYGGAGAKVGLSAGDAVGGGGSGSATYTDGTLKVEACGSVEFVVGLDLCIDGQVNLGAAYEALSPVVMQGSNFLIEVSPGVYRTSATAVQDSGIKVYKTGDIAVSTIAQGAIGSANSVAAGTISTANKVAARTVSGLYAAGAVTSGSAYKVVKDGQAAAEVVAYNAARVTVVADVAKSTANVVAGGLMDTAKSLGDAIGDGVRDALDTMKSLGDSIGDGLSRANPASWF